MKAPLAVENSVEVSIEASVEVSVEVSKPGERRANRRICAGQQPVTLRPRKSDSYG